MKKDVCDVQLWIIPNTSLYICLTLNPNPANNYPKYKNLFGQTSKIVGSYTQVFTVSVKWKIRSLAWLFD